MTGILLLTILITLFTTSIGVHSDYAMSEMNILSDDTRDELDRWRRQLSQPVIETEAIEVQAKAVEAPAEVVDLPIQLVTTKTQKKVIVITTSAPADVEPEG